jgi:hypothetical protein
MLTMAEVTVVGGGGGGLLHELARGCRGAGLRRPAAVISATMSSSRPPPLEVIVMSKVMVVMSFSLTSSLPFRGVGPLFV